MGYFDREWSITDMTNLQQPTIPAAPISLVTPKTTPGVTPVTAPKLPATFDAEEGMYDAYIKARNESIGANASKRKLERFYKKFRKQWDEGEALRRSEFNWNLGMAEANKNIDDARLGIMSRGLQVIQNFKESFKPFENPKPVVNIPIQLESAYARAKREGNTRSLVGQDPYAAAAISAEESRITPITIGFGDNLVSVNPDIFGNYNSINPEDETVFPYEKGDRNYYSKGTALRDFMKIYQKANNGKIDVISPEYKKAFNDWLSHYYNNDGFNLLGYLFSLKDPEHDAYIKRMQTWRLNNPAPNPGSPQFNTWQQEYNRLKANKFMKQGGNINKFVGGGNMNDKELQKAFAAFLIEDAEAQGITIQSEEDMRNYIQQLGDEGLAAKQLEFMLKMQGTPSRKLGGHLAYLNKLKGNCPDGEELVYMKQGGRMCPVCQKKAEKAENGKKLPKKNAVSDFKEKRKQINPNDTVNTKFGPRDLNGKTNYKKYDAKKENYDFETRMRVQEKDEKSGKKVIGSACGSKMKKKK